MIKIGILGDIGSGKVMLPKILVTLSSMLMKKLQNIQKNRRIFKKKKILPKYFTYFPINKNDVTKAILAKKII